MSWYWFTFKRGPSVTFSGFPRAGKYSAEWNGIYGLQIRGWFFGVVRSNGGVWTERDEKAAS